MQSRLASRIPGWAGLLADAPQGFYHDDPGTAATALGLARGEQPPLVYFSDNNGMDSLHIYLVALLYLFTGPIAAGPRIIAALNSTLTIPAAYWAA